MYIETQNALANINTVVRKLPPNTTHVCQPLDNFIIKVFKDLWMKAWDREKKRRIENGDFRSQSGRINRPHRHFFMNLARSCVDSINIMVDKNGISLCRKAMIRCGLSKDVNGTWNVQQLSAPLQAICMKHALNFDGTLPENTGGIVAEE